MVCYVRTIVLTLLGAVKTTGCRHRHPARAASRRKLMVRSVERAPRAVAAPHRSRPARPSRRPALPWLRASVERDRNRAGLESVRWEATCNIAVAVWTRSPRSHSDRRRSGVGGDEPQRPVLMSTSGHRTRSTMPLVGAICQRGVAADVGRPAERCQAISGPSSVRRLQVRP